MKIAVLFVFLYGCCTTSDFEYVDDKAFKASATANSPESMVFVNGGPCVDVDKIPGLCSKRLKWSEDLTFQMIPHPYAYRLLTTCSKGVFENTYNVKADEEFLVEISHENYERQKSFTCRGETIPKIVKRQFQPPSRSGSR